MNEVPERITLHPTDYYADIDAEPVEMWNEAYPDEDELTGGVEYIRADLVPQWQPIETYNAEIHPYFVLISCKNYATTGCLDKYWHDLSEGDFRITSPMCNQPTHWMPIPNLPTE